MEAGNFSLISSRRARWWANLPFGITKTHGSSLTGLSAAHKAFSIAWLLSAKSLSVLRASNPPPMSLKADRREDRRASSFRWPRWSAGRRLARNEPFLKETTECPSTRLDAPKEILVKRGHAYWETSTKVTQNPSAASLLEASFDACNHSGTRASKNTIASATSEV